MDTSSINILPTIFQNYITVTASEGNEVTVALYSDTGREVFKSDRFSYSTQLNLSELESGSYVYMVRDSNSDEVLKLGRIIKE